MAMDWFKALSIVLLILLSIQVVTITYSTEPDYTSILESKGIMVPREKLGGEVKVFHEEIKKITLKETSDKYVLPVISTETNVQYIDTPGYPMLPYYNYVLTIKGYINDVKVFIKPLSVKEISIDKKLVPVPQPLRYDTDISESIKYIPSPSIYSADKFFPGRLGSVMIYHGLLGKTLVSVKIFPIQYNPVENKLLLIDKFTLYVSYSKATPLEFKNNYLIITIPSLVTTINDTLAEFYRAKGYNVTIIDTDHIYTNYSPAPNITEYSGFYNPSYQDDTYNLLIQNYNWTLALKIISFINATLGNYSHILFIGNAKDLPPSFYFEYAYNRMDPYNNWIPTDIFYADMDRDLVPDLYVGRIPFSNKSLVQIVVNKIIAWYKSEASESNKLYMSGGYPFGLAMMFGETALSSMVLANETWSFHTVLLTRTSYNYTRETVLNVLRGNEKALWYFLLSHGSGDSFGDRIAFPEGIGFEILATTYDILSMKPNPSVPIVSSVACMNAAWDTDLVIPTWFKPPSIGEAILLSPAGGIAYIGSSRIAWEIQGPFLFSDGLVTNMYYGASLLHREIIASYNMYRVMGINTTLGEVVANGIAYYLVNTRWFSGSSFDYEIILSEIMKLSLLGDPFLALPVPNEKIEKAAILKIDNINPVGYLDAEIIFSFGMGQVPLYRPNSIGRIQLLGMGTSDVGVVVNKIIGTPYSLTTHILVSTNKTSIKNGIGLYEEFFTPMKSGKVLIKFIIPGWGEARLLATSAGLIISPERVAMGGVVNILGYGLDLLGYVSSLDLYIGGRFISRVPINTTSGFLNWTLALPYLMPGTYTVFLSMPSTYYYSPDIGQLLKLLSGNITVYSTGEINVKLIAPSIVKTGEDVSAIIVTLYNGEFRDTKLSIQVTSPSGSDVSYDLKKLSEGTYLLTFKADEKGVYKITVEAANDTQLLSLKGYNGKVLVVVDDLYELGSLIKTSAEDLRNLVLLLNTTLSNRLNDVINDIKIIGDEIAVIDTKLGEVKGIIEEVNDKVMVINTSVGKLFIRIDQLSDDVKKEITQLQDNLSTAIDSAKNEITTSIIDSLNSLKSDLSSKIEDESSKIITHVDDQYNQLKNNVIIIEAMIGILYLLTIILGGLTLKSVSRKG